MALALFKTDKQKIIAISIVAVLIAFALIQFVARPAIRASNNLTKQISQTRENLAKSEALIARKPQIDNQLVSFKAKLEDIKSALPLYSEMPNILQDISRFASESRIKIIRIEPVRQERLTKQAAQAEVGRTPLIYAEVPIKIEAKGGYHSLGAFINKIENAKNFMSVADLDIETNSADMYNHNIRVLIVAYVLQEE